MIPILEQHHIQATFSYTEIWYKKACFQSILNCQSWHLSIEKNKNWNTYTKKSYPLSALKQQQQLWEFNHVLEDISSDHNNEITATSMLNLNLFIEWLLWPFFTHINIYSSKILLLYPTKHDMSLEMNKMMPIKYLDFFRT